MIGFLLKLKSSFPKGQYLHWTSLNSSETSILIVPRRLFVKQQHNHLNLKQCSSWNLKNTLSWRYLSQSSLKTKTIIQAEESSDINASAVSTIHQAGNKSREVELDEQRFRKLSNEFVQSLNKNQSQNIENIWKDIPALTVNNVLNDYSKLTKIKLTGLVALTTLAGFYMGISGNTPFNGALLTWTLIGTALCSGSAASWNHFLEVPFDSQMRRTQNRPLVQGSLTPLHAAAFATVTGLCGLVILAAYVNPLTAALGGLNLCLYSFFYTPLKRIHIVNTWAGAIVGAIPPVMGFTAINNQIDLPSILLGLVLYSWQFPHFNALSWNMRHEYARAGYRMMSVTDPKLCQNTALRHSILLLVYTGAMCATQMTHWSFMIDMMPFSLYLIYLSYRFRVEPSSQTSRKLFFYSLIYLPVIMLLMVISKNREKNTGNKTVALKNNNDA